MWSIIGNWENRYFIWLKYKANANANYLIWFIKYFTNTYVDLNKHEYCIHQSNMVGVSTFLESSTIHGLNYISTTRKYARAFWILVVVASFSSAAHLINTSFQSWANSPIKTTVETLPITEIKFPKVTVCPPKNTFTDLNYDLMLAENFTLTNEMRDKLQNYLWKVISE